MPKDNLIFFTHMGEEVLGVGVQSWSWSSELELESRGEIFVGVRG